MSSNNPLIVQSDSTLLLEVNNTLFKETREVISAFAHLEKSPEYMHTYVITPLSLWNAASLGWKPDLVIESLKKYSKYPIPANIVQDIIELMGRFGKLILKKKDDNLLIIQSKDKNLVKQFSLHPKLSSLFGKYISDNEIEVLPKYRGHIKKIFISLGYPVHDLAGYVDGEKFDMRLRDVCLDGNPFYLREYQSLASDSFMGTSSMPGGSGVVLLPCGAGKTIVGLSVLARLKRKSLILVTNITAAHQWKREILNRMVIQEEDIGEYSGESKEIKPITIATYQILTYRKRKIDPFIHFDIFNKENWGIIIYDEVHLLPAPVFKFTAEIQARRRLGLTATLIREDGHEKDVFTLIGPKKYDVPWKVLEKQGWIASAKCIEIRVDMPHEEKIKYLSLAPKNQIRLAYENPYKISVVRDIITEHQNDKILILGQYISQIEMFSREFNAAKITGATSNQRRDELYNQFREGNLNILILSKVGNFAVDLPDANVAIQISGSFGSRQEEAQRLGRILRPKKNNEQATFYSIVTRESRELDFAMKRQLFLTEQGYPYEIQYM